MRRPACGLAVLRFGSVFEVRAFSPLRIETWGIFVLIAAFPRQQQILRSAYPDRTTRNRDPKRAEAQDDIAWGSGKLRTAGGFAGLG